MTFDTNQLTDPDDPAALPLAAAQAAQKYDH